MQEMKPCQYCGGEERLEINQYNGKYAVHCQHCGSIGPMAKNEEFAIQKWNSRIQEDSEIWEEEPNIIHELDKGFYMCPFLAINKEYDKYDYELCCKREMCAMWVWQQVAGGEPFDRGRCGLVNTKYINSTGRGAE